MIPSDEQCVAATLARDPRFDGWFIVGVTTTGIYCRPSCPTPVQPLPANMRFFASSAAAQDAGFRACKRCRPDAAPGSPEWNIRADLVGRAMRLIADGVVDRDGVPGLARRLAVSERHLNRLVTAELGAGPLALARAQRAQTARTLIETTDLPLGRVALAAGFRSVRQFNDTMRSVFGVPPGEIRGRRGASAGAGEIGVRIAMRPPGDGAGALRFLGRRAIPGVESWDGTRYRRTLALPGGVGHVTLAPRDGHVECTLRLTSLGDVQAAVSRCRRLLDADHDPVAADAHLAVDPDLARLVARAPGLRSPGTVDGTEAVVRAVVGQQVSVDGARTVLGRIAGALGDRTADGDEPGVVFPPAEALATAPDEVLPMPVRRRDALRMVCARIASGGLVVDAGADRDDARAGLKAVPGIGPWTAEYVAMRALGDPDAFPASDLGVRNALARLAGTATATAAGADAERWRPWRAYAVHHLWRFLDDPGGVP